MDRKKIIFAGILALVLAFAYFCVGNSPVENKTDEYKTTENRIIVEETANETITPRASDEKETVTETEPSEEPKQEPSVEEDNNMYCTITIKCDTILGNMSLLDESKHFLIPSDGVILEKTEVTFSEGESVFDVLLRETRNHNIHMEYMKSPVYDSAYIEGIYNLYEFDCGELSGWMYSVNGWFPNYGCSAYILKDGDNIEWVYTCVLGNDVK